MNREKEIIKTSIVGIVTNLFLSGFKVVVGLISHSIAIVLDAVNNLSDALSSVITIIGTKLANKPADKEHPYGYGRIEYMSAMLIAVIVLYAGITSFVESIKKILNPEVANYSTSTLIIVAVGVVVKVLLGQYFKNNGKKLNSDSLTNSGEDALLDAIISTATLVAAFIFIFAKISLEAYLAAIISLFIIKSGIDMLKDALSRILGERIDGELSRQIKATVCSIDGALGAYDLQLHSYGPDDLTGSIHVEVDGKKSAAELDHMTRLIQEAVKKEHGVFLEAIGFYGLNTLDEESQKIQDKVIAMAKNHAHVMQVHGFYLNTKNKTMNYDIVVSFDDKDPISTYQKVVDEVQKAYPDYTITVALDRDTSD